MRFYVVMAVVFKYSRKYNIVVLNEIQRLNKSTKVTQENK